MDALGGEELRGVRPLDRRARLQAARQAREGPAGAALHQDGPRRGLRAGPPGLRPMRLHSRVYLHSLVVLLVVGAATSLVFAIVDRGGTVPRDGRADRPPRGAVAAERLRRRSAALARRLERLHADLDLDVTVRDLDGRVLASAGRAEPPPPADALAAARAGQRDRARDGPCRTRWRRCATRDSGAVVGDGGGVAAPPLRRAGPGAPAAVRGGRAARASPLATRPLARRLSRPLERLTDAARRLGGGDLAARAPAPPRAAGGAAGQAGRRDRRAHARVQRDGRAGRAAGRGQKELLANVSHELRSPLARIRMALALLSARRGPRRAPGRRRARPGRARAADRRRAGHRAPGVDRPARAAG